MTFVRKFFVLVVFAINLGCGVALADITIEAPDVAEALKSVDRELERRDIYLARRSGVIDSLSMLIKELPRRTPRRMELMLELSDAYAGYLTDSAFLTCERGESLARDIGDKKTEMLFKLKKLSIMPVSGFGSKAIEAFEKINIDSLDDELRLVALESGRQMYSYQASFFVNYDEEYALWLDKSIEMQKMLIDALPKGSEKYMLNRGEYFFLTGHPSEARAVLLDLLDSIPHDTNVAARASHIISRISKKRNDTDSHLYYLAKSAVADIKSATREMVSLQELGITLYDRHDIDRAYNYIGVALAYAVECNASMRMLQTSEALPVISAAYRDSLSLSRQRLYFALATMSLLLIVLMVVLYRLRKEMGHMKQLQQILANANRVKEMYMSQFINLCTIYMDKLNQFCKIAARKISTGHADDLYKMTKSGRFVEEQSQEFYETFDKAFLHIYPTFVDDVNALLKPDEVIVLKEGEMLNTDLRILAFMRLGVEESTRIAQVLNYSVHTIYAYRNRLKNRAADRENFETDIMKIGAL